MFLKLRVLFTILSALCLTVAITAGAIWGFLWTIILGMGALLFFMLMLVFKGAQESREQQEAENNKFFTSDTSSSNISPNDTSPTDKE